MEGDAQPPRGIGATSPEEARLWYQSRHTLVKASSNRESHNYTAAVRATCSNAKCLYYTNDRFSNALVMRTAGALNI